jgi:threonine/homoserine/homoserine lactone efflux protein
VPPATRIHAAVHSAVKRAFQFLIQIKAVRSAHLKLANVVDNLTFLIGSAALLAAPGPTNILLAASGAIQGIRKSAVLLVAEVLGYVIAIAILITAVGPVIVKHSFIGLALRIAVAAYLLRIAWALWTTAQVAVLDHCPIGFRQVFVTTVLNPKAIIFAFAIVPFGPTGDLRLAAPWLAVLSALIVVLGACWIAAGSMIHNRGQHVPIFSRACALVMIGFAGLMVVTS